MIHSNLQPHSTEVDHSKIKVEENGRQVVFINKERESYFLIRVDGQLVKNTITADFVLSKPAPASEKKNRRASKKNKPEDETAPIAGDVVIELKGCDVNHALQQVMATATLWHNSGYRVGKIAALIVASKAPKYDSALRRTQQQFATKFKGPVHLVTAKKPEFKFERVLAFDGPD